MTDWDKYCELGYDDCMDMNCPCVDNIYYRFKCARARKARGLEPIRGTIMLSWIARKLGIFANSLVEGFMFGMGLYLFYTLFKAWGWIG